MPKFFGKHAKMGVVQEDGKVGELVDVTTMSDPVKKYIQKYAAIPEDYEGSYTLGSQKVDMVLTAVTKEYVKAANEVAKSISKFSDVMVKNGDLTTSGNWSSPSSDPLKDIIWYKKQAEKYAYKPQEIVVSQQQYDAWKVQGQTAKFYAYDEVAPVPCPSPQSVVINTLGATFEVPIPSAANSPVVSNTERLEMTSTLTF